MKRSMESKSHGCTMFRAKIRSKQHMHLVRSDGELYKVRNSDHNLEKIFFSHRQKPSNRASELRQTARELIARYSKAMYESRSANENCLLRID